jgi:hypothetical protein
VACPVGTRSAPVTGAHLQAGIGWVDSEILLLSAAHKTVAYGKLPADNRTFLRDLTSGRIEELTDLAGTPGNAFVNYGLNPADPDLLSLYRKGDAYYYLANRRTEAQTAIMAVPPEEDVVGTWSPDSTQVACDSNQVKDGQCDIYAVTVKAIRQVANDLPMEDSLSWR